MDIAATRLRNQTLARTDCQAPEAVVRWLGAVQAQEYAPARWAVGMRTRRATDADVVRACDEGRILRLHILRPTWHFVAPADIRWMLSLSGPRVNAINAHYYGKLGLDGGIFTRSRRAIERALTKGQHLTRLELAGVLSKAGIEASGQRLAYLMMRAELDGVICNGACRGKKTTYALLDERAPAVSRMSRDEALAMLAARYFTSHGPATLRDYVWWSGLTVKEARIGIEGAGAGLRRVTIDDRVHWLAASGKGLSKLEPLVFLLPVYDEYLIAYKDRESIRDLERPSPAPVRIEFPHFLIINGKLRGTWKRTSRAGRMEIELSLFRPLTNAEFDGLESEADRYGSFIGFRLHACRLTNPRGSRQDRLSMSFSLL
jgi:Winged helix DNA-binding domain